MIASRFVTAGVASVLSCIVVLISADSCNITNMYQIEDVGAAMCRAKTLFEIKCADPVINEAMQHLNAGPMPPTPSAFPCPKEGPRAGGCNYTVENMMRSDFGPDGQPKTCGDWTFHASCLNAQEMATEKLPCSDKKRPGGG